MALTGEPKSVGCSFEHDGHFCAALQGSLTLEGLLYFYEAQDAGWRSWKAWPTTFAKRPKRQRPSLFLKAHANEGMVAGHYEINGQLFYELNVAWHHGESGGPVFRIDPVAGFAVLQQYRNVQTPHGTIPGPRQGRSLNVIEAALRNVGALMT